MVVAEGHRVGVTLVKEFVSEWKRQRQEVFVPLVYRPGDLGEVDFFEVLVDVAGRRRKAGMFRKSSRYPVLTRSAPWLPTGATKRLRPRVSRHRSPAA